MASLQHEVMTKLKEAMKAKDKIALESLRAIKSELLLVQTSSKSNEDITAEDEIKILQKLVKQRKESAALYNTQGRQDLAEPELKQVEVISQFLPKQLSTDEIKLVVSKVIEQVGASSMKDMGKVMRIVSKQLAGKADGKTISSLVKELLG